MNEQYKINKIGLINYWLYDEEEFYFCDGKLLLRGSNGTGKSVTMLSFFPMILDGNKSPERLDSFGGRERKIEDYLLPEGISENENTAYLYMELKNGKNEYLSFGIGLKAIRNKKVEFWGFIITDNRRIGQDFLLYKERNYKVPLTKRELQVRIGTGGQVVDNQKEYKRMINQYLFDFQNMDTYTELLNLIIQIRAPKLTKDFKPSKLSEILSNVLEPLSDEDLQSMSDSIESMNKYKEKIEELKQEKSKIDLLGKTFEEYNRTLLQQKLISYLNEEEKSKKQKEEILQLKEEMAGKETELENVKQKITDIKLEKDSLQHKQNSFQNTNLEKTTNEIADINQTLKSLEEDKENKEEQYEKKSNERIEKTNNIKHLDGELNDIEKEINDKIKILEEFAEELNISEFSFYLNEIKEEKNIKNQDLSNGLNKLITSFNNLSKSLAALEKMQENFNQLKSNYEEKENQINKKIKEKEQISKEIIQNLEIFQDTVFEEANRENFDLSEQNKQDIINTISSLDKKMFSKIKDIIKNRITEIVSTLRDKIFDYQKEKTTLESKRQLLEQENETQDSILEKELENKDAKNYFEEHNIMAKYLYECIEFKDEIEEKQRKNIESALYSLGILTSFVTESSQNLPDSIAVKVIHPESHKANNLSKYFVITDDFYYEQVEKILESISINEDDFYISEQGAYRMKIIEGKTATSYKLKYIGENTRIKYIETEKEKIRAEISILNREIEKIGEKINELELEIQKQKSFQVSFDEEKVCKQFADLDSLDAEMEVLKKDIIKITEKIRAAEVEINTKKKEIKEENSIYNGEDTLEIIREKMEILRNFERIYLNLNNCVHNYQAKKEIQNNNKENEEKLFEDCDTAKSELEKIEYQIKNYQNRKNTLLELLESEEYKDIKEEYLRIQTRLRQIDDEDSELSNTNGKLEQQIITGKNSIETLEKQLEGEEIILKVKQDIYNQEYNLGYVESVQNETDLKSVLKCLRTEKPISVKDSSDRLGESIQKHIPFLADYAPKNVYIFANEENDYLKYTTDEDMKEEINNLLEDAKRKDITFYFNGKIVNLLQLSREIQIGIDSNSELLREEDRKLFEDLLMNNIGSSIRKKIASSQEWIQKVKEQMESMNTSSGLNFSIAWNGKEKEGEQELDTKEVVRIFSKKAEMLKQEDFDKIIEHFRSKISSKEEVLEENERNYLEIISDVLDYRKWFEFKLYFRRGNQEKRELTDKEFSKFSGGEKALAMYIPLFAGCYAKYKSARNPKAPKIIALDEAFAGVDDVNIKDSFRILDSLNLDYIMTSQALWGDYDTVRHLAISELHRPLDSNIVNVIRYKWDGIKKTVVTKEEEYE